MVAGMSNKKNAYLLTRAAKEIDEHIADLREKNVYLVPAQIGYLFGLETAAGILRTMAKDRRNG